MITATIKEINQDKVKFITECQINGEISLEKLEKLKTSRGQLKCPFYTGNDCNTISFRAVKNKFTNGQYVQVRCPKCVPDERVSPKWNYTEESGGKDG